MEVRKTIVIGLGSTGTEVCRKVTERIDWEVGGWTRASWCRFVCLETNASQRRPLDAAFRFIPLRIEATEYERVLRNYQDYDARLGLKTWADIDTLQRLDSREVSAGAGNIRMVGRLAFLWERNLVQVKQVLTSELSTLRALSEAEAAERIGTLPDGTQPNIRFVQNGVIRVIVVGTLCGGTCSGLAADFGYFLRSILTEDEKCIAIFTLPHPQRSRAIEPLADRHKRNAYTALVELNHYSLLHLPRPEETYPDGTPVNNRGLPWDLIFLVAPRDADNESLERLNQAVADRIFLNVFVPLADPFSRAVDATMAEDEVAGGMHRARVFSTFGLSSLEFPAAQVLDACAKRLLCHALSEWNNRTLEDRERDQI
ncbi:MAG: hypothetical protein H5T86_14595, partial [Armatimonadetes bacterium]|nr:hypothetical protein [Armatimonadota bacterium]